VANPLLGKRLHTAPRAIEGDITTIGISLLSADCHFDLLHFNMRQRRPCAALRYNQA
jgi:hypothetical protein